MPKRRGVFWWWLSKVVWRYLCPPKNHSQKIFQPLSSPKALERKECVAQLRSAAEASRRLWRLLSRRSGALAPPLLRQTTPEALRSPLVHCSPAPPVVHCSPLGSPRSPSLEGQEQSVHGGGCRGGQNRTPPPVLPEANIAGRRRHREHQSYKWQSTLGGLSDRRGAGSNNEVGDSGECQNAFLTIH